MNFPLRIGQLSPTAIESPQMEHTMNVTVVKPITPVPQTKTKTIGNYDVEYHVPKKSPLEEMAARIAIMLKDKPCNSTIDV